MIVVLFLASLVVMELILKRDGNNREEREERPDDDSSMTPNLLSLARAIKPEKDATGVVKNEPEYNREDARSH